MARRPCLAITAVVLCACVVATAPSAAEPPTVAAPSATTSADGPAADGTASVVVPATEPSASPPDALPEESGPTVAVPPVAAPPVTGPPLVPPPVDVPAVAVPADAAQTVDAPVATGAEPAEAAPTVGAAANLLDAALGPAAPGQAAIQSPAVRPLTLLEALRRPGDPSRRLWIAQAYWKVSAACAWLHWASAAVERLELVAPGSDPHDRAVLDVATAAARADLAEARSQLGVTQQELVDLARLPITEPLPWPVDRPLASPYQTHFDAIFATRLATGRTRAIARTLPERHEALEARAAAVTAAGHAAALAEADHAKGKRPIEAVIAAHTALVGQQREFVGAVRAYNLDIAEYAMAAADMTVPDDRFVSMLIGTPVAVPPAAATAAGLSPPGTIVGGGPTP